MTEKVLIVDDDLNILYGFRRHFRKHFNVVTVSNAEKALEALDKDGPFSVIVADMMMPGMNGIQLLRECNLKSPNTVRIMLTGCTERQIAIDAVNEGQVFRFLTKPSDVDELLRTIEAGLEQYRITTTQEKQLLWSSEELLRIRGDLKGQQDWFNALADALYVVDNEMALTDFNLAFEALVSLGKNKLQDKNFIQFFPENEHPKLESLFLEAYEKGVASIEISFLSNDGRFMTLHISAVTVMDENADFAGYIGSIHDISERKSIESHLRKAAETDELTGLNNRRYFFERAKREIERARRHGFPVSVIMMDIDHFKRVNDLHGHVSGDKVLQKMASICLNSIRSTDVVARFGGEEFVILLPDANIDTVKLRAEIIRQRIEEASFETDQGALNVTVSLGVATTDDGTGGIMELIERADSALYTAKSKGRNRVETEQDHPAAVMGA